MSEVAMDIEKPPPPEKTREQGIRCPLCNCADIPVKFTRHYGERTKQTRECGNCGKRFGVWLKVIPERSPNVEGS